MMQGKGFGSFIVIGSVQTDTNGRISSDEIGKIAKQLEESVEAKVAIIWNLMHLKER